MKTHIFKKLLPLLGAACTLSAAALPLASYAADTADTAVEVTVVSILDVHITPHDVEVTPGQANSGTIDATVTSNSGFDLAFKSAQPDLVNNAYAPEKTYYIPAVLEGGSVSAGHDAWGIKCTDDLPVECDKTTYTGVATTDTVFAHSESAVTNKSFGFTVGASTVPGKPSGTYKTTVTLTALAR